MRYLSLLIVLGCGSTPSEVPPDPTPTGDTGTANPPGSPTTESTSQVGNISYWRSESPQGSTNSVYALFASEVRERTPELGLKTALGAGRQRILREVLSEAARLALIGLPFGLAAAALAARVLEGYLFGVAPFDPRSHALGLGVLLLTALASAWVPSLRAARLDPADALRAE